MHFLRLFFISLCFFFCFARRSEEEDRPSLPMKLRTTFVETSKWCFIWGAAWVTYYEIVGTKLLPHISFLRTLPDFLTILPSIAGLGQHLMTKEKILMGSLHGALIFVRFEALIFLVRRMIYSIENGIFYFYFRFSSH